MVLAMALGGAGASVAGAVWIPMGPWGGQINSLAGAPLNPDVLFSAGNELFKTRDGGVSWERVPVAQGLQLRCVAVAGAGDETVAVATAGRKYPLYVSPDGGDTWEQVSDDAFADNEVYWLCFTSDTAPGRLLVACTSEGILVSQNGVTDWNEAGQGIPEYVTPVFFTCSAPGKPRYFFACDQEGRVYRSEDLSSGWEAVQVSDAPVKVYRVAVQWDDREQVWACGPDGVFKSTDGGSTWDHLLSLAKDRVAIARSMPSVVYLAGPHGVTVTPDGGISWVERSRGLVIGNWVTGDLVISPDSPLDAWIGSLAGVYRTNDAGDWWHPANLGISVMTVNSLAVSGRTEGLIFAVTEVGLFRKTQLTDWQLLGTRRTRIHLSIEWVKLDPTDDATVYAWTRNWQLIKSTQMGDNETWETILEPNCSVSGMAIDHQTGQNLYLATGRGVMVSRDGGQSWEECNSGLPDGETDVKLISIAATDPKILWIGIGDVFGAKDIYKSTDAAHSWAKVRTSKYPVNCITIDPSDPNVVYLGTAGGNGVERAIYGGQGFTFMTSGLDCRYVNDIAVDPTDPRNVYCATGQLGATSFYAGLYALHPAGTEWRRIDCPMLTQTALLHLAIDPWQRDQVLCAFLGNSLYRCQKEPGPPIEVALSTDENRYSVGDVHVARISATNTGGDMDVDLYIAIMLPDGSLWFWPEFSSEMRPGLSMTPMPGAFSMSDLTFLQMELPEGLPAGTYTWFAMFFGYGSQDAVSNLASCDWTLQ